MGRGWESYGIVGPRGAGRPPGPPELATNHPWSNSCSQNGGSGGAAYAGGGPPPAAAATCAIACKVHIRMQYLPEPGGLEGCRRAVFLLERQQKAVEGVDLAWRAARGLKPPTF
jgi:hypothetical protein